VARKQDKILDASSASKLVFDGDFGVAGEIEENKQPQHDAAQHNH
jgi:hypothetical protein